MRVNMVRHAAKDINLYELAPLGGASLPDAAPGSHIDFHLPNGLIRSYSLISAGVRPVVYTVAIKRDEASRGGSAFVHESLRVGMAIKITAPCNNFELDESAAHSTFIAGGIGITPIRAMAERVSALGRSWSLFYSCRDRDDAAFLFEFEGRPNVKLHFDSEHGGKHMEIAAIVAGVPAGGHVYCCGPAPMLHAFEAAAKDMPPDQVHVEYFNATQDKATAGGYWVELARTGARFQIPPGHTILQVLEKNGIDIAYSCQAGVCGTCEVAVLSGVPDHRDEVLSEADKADGHRMMICCSGSLGEVLVLDL
jgi:ferredoxin-NADP reductase